MKTILYKKFLKICVLVLYCLILSKTVNSQNIINTLGLNGSFTVQDISGTFMSLSQSTGYLNLYRSISLANTTNSTTGIIFKGGNRFIHDYQPAAANGLNLFIGTNSGNFSMNGNGTQSSYNVALGYNTLNQLFTGSNNSALGYSSQFSNTNGANNSSFGFQSLYTNTTGGSNSAFGSSSLFSNNGSYNSAFGYRSLYSNGNAFYNSAFGYASLYLNTTGTGNSAFGYNSMYFNTANYNSAFGYEALYSNTIGLGNSSFGSYSLNSNNIGANNSAFGYNVLQSNNAGNSNSAFGKEALNSNTTGTSNSSFGVNSLFMNSTGDFNSAFGNNTLYNNTSTGNTAIGYFALNSNTTGNTNTAIGYYAGSTVTIGSNLTLIGNGSQPSNVNSSNQITLGNNFVGSLRCNVQTITSLSDARDKKNVSPLSLGLSFLMKLRPRQFNWDRREWYDENISDGSKIQQTPTAGFIAQELDEVQSSENAEWLNLVLKDNPDKWEATYGNLLPVMVKAIQELKEENDKLKKEIEVLKSLEERLTIMELTILKETSLKEIKTAGK